MSSEFHNMFEVTPFSWCLFNRGIYYLFSRLQLQAEVCKISIISCNKKIHKQIEVCLIISKYSMYVCVNV